MRRNSRPHQNLKHAQAFVEERRTYPIKTFLSLCPQFRSKDEPTSQEAIDEQRIHAPHEVELEVSSSFSYLHLEDIQESWTTVDEEHPFEPQIE